MRKTANIALDDVMRVRMVHLVRGGASLPHAAQACGIDHRTVREWFMPHQRDREPYYTFCQEVEKAAADWAIEVAGRIQSAGAEGDWKADAWLLSRRCRDEYGDKSAVEVSGANGGPMLMGHVDLTKEQALERLKLELEANPQLLAALSSGQSDG